MNRFGATIVAALAMVLTLCVAQRASAEAPRVLLVRPPDAAPEVRTALVRVQGELAADGFEVVPVEAAPGADSAMSMLQAENSASTTTIGLFLSADGTNAELWVVDKLTDKTVVRRLATSGQPENALPEVLALRVVELLRASLLELVVERNNAAAASASKRKASEWALRPLRREPLVWGIETGGALLWNPGQVEPAFMLLARARFAPSRALNVRLSWVGLGTRPQLKTESGSASIAQSFALAELLLTPARAARLGPMFSLGGGAFRTSVSGLADRPYRALSDAGWALALDAGSGFSLRLGARLELEFELHAEWLVPRPIVQFVNQDGAHLGRPCVVGSISLLGWL